MVKRLLFLFSLSTIFYNIHFNCLKNIFHSVISLFVDRMDCSLKQHPNIDDIYMYFIVMCYTFKHCALCLLSFRKCRAPKQRIALIVWLKSTFTVTANLQFGNVTLPPVKSLFDIIFSHNFSIIMGRFVGTLRFSFEFYFLASPLLPHSLTRCVRV